VPSEAGRLWAQVGQTALEAGRQIQNSALNPAVRQQMKEAALRAQAGQAISQYAMKHPKFLRAVGGETPQGATIAAPATLPVSQVTQWDLDVDQDQDTKPSPKNPPPPPPPEEAKPEEAKPEETKPKSHQEEMGQVSFPGGTRIAQGPTVNRNLSASADHDFLVRRMIQERQAAGLGGSEAAQQGTPAGMTFLNPATGNIQPLQTGPPAQGGSIWSPPGPTQPPPAPGQPPAPAQAPGSAISQITQQPGVALANWQAQNVHPVIAPKAVLDAFRTHVSTAAQDATYLPNGGVNGEPAWAIHMKGGGQTTISASQLAQSPWGRTLMATHNASEVMEAQQNQGQQPPLQTNQPGNMLLQPPQPQAIQPQAAQPPPAPGPSDYNAAPYRQMVATAMAQPGGLLAQEGQQAGVRSTDTAGPPPDTPAERTQAETRSVAPQTIQIPTPPEEVKELNSDADAQKRKRIWDRDPSDVTKGSVDFTRKPSPRAGFYEQRFYRGSPGWEDGLWTPDAQKRQDVLDIYGSASSGIPRGRDHMLDYDQIKKKSMPEIDSLLAEAVWWKTHDKAMDQRDQDRLNAESNASRSYSTLLDMAQWAKEHKIDPKDYNADSILKATEAAVRDGIMTQEEGSAMINDLFLFPTKGQPTEGMPPALQRMWDLAQYAYHDVFAGYRPRNPFARAVGSRIKELTSTLDLLPEYSGRAISSPDWPTERVGLIIPQWHVNLGVPTATEPSKIPEINSMVTGNTPDEAIRNYTEMKRRVDGQYIKDVKNLAYAGKRVPQDDIDNMKELSKENGRIKNNANNPMRDNDGNLINPYDPSHHATAATAATPATPTDSSALEKVDTYDSSAVDKFLKAHPQGGWVTNPEGKRRYIGPQPPQ
jgi:hypothetical protein